MTIRTGSLLTAALCIALISEAGASTPSVAEVSARLEAGSRSTEDQARDAGRKPADVVAFLGIAPGMTVVDLIAAGGYYTEVLALAVGPTGKVYSQNTQFVLEVREGANDKALTARLAENRLPNVERLDREMAELGLEPGSVDAAVTALNFHDIYNRGGPEAAAALLASVYTILVPGGMLAIIDHSGGVGDDQQLHRIDEALVLESVQQAGFEVEATSPLLRNPQDDRSKFVFAEGMRGTTDRFVLRLRKPRTPAAN